MRFFGPRVRGSFNISKVVHRKETTPACIERSAKVLADHPSLSLSLSLSVPMSLCQICQAWPSNRLSLSEASTLASLD